MADTVCAFDQLTSEQTSAAGGKGGTLARLYQAGYPVPDGLVVLPGAFAGDELAPAAWAQVQAHLTRLRAGDPQAGFAVRSSALGEDSARASFAGEFETVLDVHTDAEVRAAIHAVRRSRHSERVRAYVEARGLDADPETAVVVQRLVPAALSGVLFSADPVTGSRERMIGNYVHGRGERLVSGTTTPYEFTLSRPQGRYDGPPELKRFARRLFKLSRRLERDLGSPQDIEWAIAQDRPFGGASFGSAQDRPFGSAQDRPFGSAQDRQDRPFGRVLRTAVRALAERLQGGRDGLYILQSRPITTLLGFDPLTGECNDSLTGDYVWSSVNLGEAVSVVMTPFTWFMMRTGFGELNILPGHPSVGNIGGRLYQNSTVMATVLRALGKNIKDIVKEMGGVRDEYLDRLDEFLVPLPGVTLLTILPNALRVRRKEQGGLKNLAAFLAENPDWCRAMRRRAQALETRDELLSFLDEMLPRAIESFWRNYATALRYGECVGPLRRELTELVGAADADALLSNVSGQDELLASLGPLVGLSRLARGEMSREAYLEQWGHRGALETEASVPRPAEDPGWLDRQLVWFEQSPVDVEGMLRAQRAAFEAAWERFQSRYPRQVRSMRRRLEGAAEAARTREAARSESARIIWVARTWALRVGDVTGIGDGVFFLTGEELRDLLSGVDVSTSAIPARRRTYERYQALPRYPLSIRGRFDPFQWAADPHRRSDVFDSHGLLTGMTLTAPRENVILGMPGSAGQVEGLVRRLDGPEQGGELQAGEILVTSQTNIGWTLFFPRAAAIVTDVGAPLSHAAIVARELGIPAVVNCGGATARLRTGQRVRVDGVQGTVEILEAGA